jgi:hypothetical protein
MMAIFRCSQRFKNIRILGGSWFYSYFDLPDDFKLTNFHKSLAFDNQILIFAMKDSGESTAKNFFYLITIYLPRLG